VNEPAARSNVSTIPRSFATAEEIRYIGFMMMERIREALEADLPALRERFALKRLAVFGSVARGSESEDSDVDVLVEFEQRVGFDEFMDLRFHLEDLLGVRVDLVTAKAIRPGMRDSIEREAIRVA
jgi:hypothetical protein